MILLCVQRANHIGNGGDVSTCASSGEKYVVCLVLRSHVDSISRQKYLLVYSGIVISMQEKNTARGQCVVCVDLYLF